MNRRTFLKIAGLGSISWAAGCSPPEKHLFSQVHVPDDMVTGKATWYASTCRECPAGCGILAKNREGRVIKVEGNPLHPINRGWLCMRGQAALQGIYNPDRIKTPLLKTKDGWQPLSFAEAQSLLKTKIIAAARKGPDRTRMLTEVIGASLSNLFAASLLRWNSQAPLIFEPYAYESLKTANQKVFGINGLASYRMEQADVLLAFGADFLETWLSPIEYAWKFKAMHAIKDGHKGFFFHISPFQSLTAANADQWLRCNPGSEAAIALGLVKQALDIRKGKRLPAAFRNALYPWVAPYTQERVLELSGLELAVYEKLIIKIFDAKKPLILGTATGAPDANSLQINLAVNLINLMLDPNLSLLDFSRRHRVETAARRSEVVDFIKNIKMGTADVLLLNNVNPVFALPSETGMAEALQNPDLFSVSFSNFMDETTELVNLILPVSLPLETWDEYGGWQSIFSPLQPAMGSLTKAPHLGDVFLNLADNENDTPTESFKAYLFSQLVAEGRIVDEIGWVRTLQNGGIFDRGQKSPRAAVKLRPQDFEAVITAEPSLPASELVFQAAPSIRFFDGREANRSWVCEIPDPLTMVAWQTPVLMHLKRMQATGLSQGDIVKIDSKWGSLEAPIYDTENIHPDMLVMSIGQGHSGFGRYAKGMGFNPLHLMSPEFEPVSGAPLFSVRPVSISPTGRTVKLAHTDGSRLQHGRKIALSTTLETLKQPKPHQPEGLGMWEFPFTLPLPEGYSPQRDFYPPHEHDAYRWAMVIDLDRCIGCSACACACYAENNLGVTGEQHMREGREMAWLQVQRYFDPAHRKKVTFLPMLCQHCDNAPCESVCPVFAPHHNKEGINNQIYNRCIGTRFCSQNCPYKVRRFNWFDWKWPAPLNLQLNPDVTVRSKGVMEKCSFCIQRIKTAHNQAKNENRMILDGEVTPACVQTCPTGALIFGNLKDTNSRVRRLCENPRAYQVMGYMNTKPAVIYLKKVLHEV